MTEPGKYWFRQEVIGLNQEDFSFDQEDFGLDQEVLGSNYCCCLNELVCVINFTYYIGKWLGCFNNSVNEVVKKEVERGKLKLKKFTFRSMELELVTVACLKYWDTQENEFRSNPMRAALRRLARYS